MIRLTRAIVAARPWHALALFLLGMLAIGSAVAAPAYARMAQASVAGSDVGAASNTDTSATVGSSIKLRPFDPSDPTDQAVGDPSRIPHTLPVQLRIRGFASVFDATLHLAGGRSGADYTNPETRTLLQNSVLSFRSGSCVHVVLVSGRCVTAPMEVMISQNTAQFLHRGVGGTMEVHFVQPVATQEGVVYLPVGEPQTLAVVGVYQIPRLSSDPYWVGSPLSVAGPEQLTGLIGPDTLTALQPFVEDQSFTIYPMPGALAPEKLDGVRADLSRSAAQVRATGVTVNTQLPKLLDRIATDQRRAAIGPTVAGVPLVVLCWFVIFLAVAQTAQARRPELALLKLRGTGALERWWLAAAESVVPLLGGAVAGFVIGSVAVFGYGRLTLAHPGPIGFNGTSMLYAGTALAGALIAGLLALRRDLRAPVAELLRRVTRHPGRWQSAVTVSVVATLAAVAVFEAHDNPTTDPTGLVLLGPALTVLAVGLLLAGLLDPVAERVGTFALRRGRLGLALAALQIGRPRSSRRVVALLTVAVGLFVFAVTANDVSLRARELQARYALGAARVLTVDTSSPDQLLRAVREVDPAGAFAMAAEVLPADGRTGAALLAVDSPRLATVAFWPGSGTPAQAAQAVRPAVAEPVTVTGRDVLVDATLDPGPAGQQTDPRLGPQASNTIVATFVPLAGGSPIISTEVPLRPGAHSYRLEMPCLQGCRLIGLSPHLLFNSAGAAKLKLTGFRTGEGRTVLVTGEQFGHWLDHSHGSLLVHPRPDGLEVEAQVFAQAVILLQPPDQTGQLPVVRAGDSDVQTLSAFSGPLFGDNVATTTTLPRLGTSGGLGDLELVVRDGVRLRGAAAEVWLNDAAPPDIVDRITRAGLPVLRDRRLADAIADAGQRPGALGWRFLVVLGALALTLGVAGLLLAAAVERRPRAYALRAMRTQGLSWPAVTVSGVVGYVSLVVCGVVFGAGAAMVAWWLDGAYLPIVEGRPLGQGLPGWPSSLTLSWWGVAAATLFVVALGATAALARVVRLGRRTDFGGGAAS